MVSSELVVSAPRIYVIDEDPSVGRALLGVGQLLGISVSVYSSANEFLANYDPAAAGCVIMELAYSQGMNGLELQKRMNQQDICMPMIFVTGRANVRLAVEVMRNGAVTLLEKPFQLDELTGYIRQAIALDGRQREEYAKKRETETRLSQLTRKEREVFDLVATGKTNKQIAAMLQLSLRAVEDRRARVMRKLEVRSVVDLLQFHASNS